MAILQVKLAADVGQRVPPAQVVIHAHARVPLRHVVDLSLLRHAPGGASAPHARDRVVVLHVNLQLAVRLHRLGKANLHARVVDDVVGLRCLLTALKGDGLEDDAVGRGHRWSCAFGIGAPAAACAATRQPRARVLAVDVLFHLHPQARQQVRAVVGIGDDLVVPELLRVGVQLGVHLVAGLVLPVRRPGRAIAAAVGVHRIGQRERSEGQAGIVRRRGCLREDGLFCQPAQRQ